MMGYGKKNVAGVESIGIYDLNDKVRNEGEFRKKKVDELGASKSFIYQVFNFDEYIIPDDIVDIRTGVRQSFIAAQNLESSGLTKNV